MSLVRLLILGLAAVPALACASASTSSSEAPITTASDDPATILAGMTLEEKVGQLFVDYAYGTSADTTDAGDVAQNQQMYGLPNAAALIAKYHLGGIIYFNWAHNLNDPAQIAHLSNTLQTAASSISPKVPLMIGTDQETGPIVVRVGPPATQFPGEMAVGASRSLDDACTVGTITGQEMHALGINLAFAPDADVNVNPKNPVIGLRSYGEDPTLVATMVSKQVGCMQTPDGIAATGKHFPGHGDTDVDSHTGIPIINHTLEQWNQIDAPPFQAVIAAGIESIMSAHIIVPALDPANDPSTLSKPIMTGILREKLGYDGVVITDSLGMAGVRAKYGDAEVPLRALEAGVDQLLMPPNLDLAYNSVLGAVHSGRIPESRIDQSVMRVLKMKQHRGILTNAMVDETQALAKLGTPDHLAAAQALTDRTITLLRNDGDALPLAPNTGKSVYVTGWGNTTTASLATKIGKRGVTAIAKPTGATPTDSQIATAVSDAATHDVVVVVTNRADYEDASSDQTTQQKLITQLLATGKPVIVATAKEPYDPGVFGSAPAVLATLGYADVTLESLVRVLFGEVNPSGKLPVHVPGADENAAPAYPFGAGISYGAPAPAVTTPTTPPAATP